MSSRKPRRFESSPSPPPSSNLDHLHHHNHREQAAGSHHRIAHQPQHTSVVAAHRSFSSSSPANPETAKKPRTRVLYTATIYADKAATVRNPNRTMTAAPPPSARVISICETCNQKQAHKSPSRTAVVRIIFSVVTQTLQNPEAQASLKDKQQIRPLLLYLQSKPTEYSKQRLHG
ncbi:hypothetical protein V8G54_037589 [Vigna mungo]|uniref:Uncharacterized protein n=1 Tax=Vigna mungo TaxID=3915 RepID=A0AAQ3MJI5_VIGMU